MHPSRTRTARSALAPVLCLALLALACGARPDPNLAPARYPVVGRLPDGALLLRWSDAPAGRAYTVYASGDADGRARGEAIGVLRRGENASGLRLPALPDTPRPYFALRDDATGRTRVVAQRLLAIEGTHNFRDFGGWETRDGRQVRWGQLYRSDHLGDLSEAGRAQLAALDIRLLCDFRGEKERAEHPDRLPAAGAPETVVLGIADPSFDPEALRRQFMSGDFSDAEIRDLLVVGNRKFATEYHDRYARLFERLLAPGGLPLLIHCTAGKDRTGFGAALILRALGVPDETIFDDFMATNVYAAEHIERTLQVIRLASLFRTAPERVRPVLGVRRAYLEAAFESIDATYGSFDRYRREILGVDDVELERLRAVLLTEG